MKFLNLKKIKDKQNKGFTIVESLFAILILLLAITGPLYFTQGGLRASFVSRDQVTAFFLAQDAIEYIKNVRDNMALEYLFSTNPGNVDGWLHNLEDCDVDTNTAGCTIDTVLEVSNVSAVRAYDSTIPLKNNTTGPDGTRRFFGHSGDNSIFYRKIEINEFKPGVEAEITVTVTWETQETIGTRSIVVKENIMNWARNL